MLVTLAFLALFFITSYLVLAANPTQPEPNWRNPDKASPVMRPAYCADCQKDVELDRKSRCLYCQGFSVVRLSTTDWDAVVRAHVPKVVAETRREVEDACFQYSQYGT
jgi:DNA-directed RNA polymerase subunit RPC12/RpoP